MLEALGGCQPMCYDTKVKKLLRKQKQQENLMAAFYQFFAYRKHFNSNLMKVTAFGNLLMRA